MANRGRWPGTWAAICDRCGFRYASDLLKEDWQGLRLCRKCYEPRHPQEFVRGVPDNPAPPWTRPEPADLFVEFPLCTLLTSVAMANMGTAGCATVGRTI